MRLGSYPAELLPGSIVAKRYGQAHVEERHRHRYEVNNAYRDRLEDAGLVISGTSPDSKLVEFIELPSEIHPYFVATRRIQNSSRGRPGRTRSSALSRRRWTGSWQPGFRWTTTIDDHSRSRRAGRRAARLAGRVVDRAGQGHDHQLLQDQVRNPDGDLIARIPPSIPAVGVIALDDHDRVALVRQYRHPVRHRLIEPPAGLLHFGEDYLQAMQRELAEEVGLAARNWAVLVDLFTTPGILQESLRIYIARDLTRSMLPTASPAKERRRTWTLSGRPWTISSMPSSMAGCTTRPLFPVYSLPGSPGSGTAS